MGTWNVEPGDFIFFYWEDPKRQKIIVTGRWEEIKYNLNALFFLGGSQKTVIHRCWEGIKYNLYNHKGLVFIGRIAKASYS